MNRPPENEFTVLGIQECRSVQHTKSLRRTYLGKEVLVDQKLEQFVIQLGCCDSDSSDSSSKMGQNTAEDLSGIEIMQF